MAIVKKKGDERVEFADVTAAALDAGIPKNRLTDMIKNKRKYDGWEYSIVANTAAPEPVTETSEPVKAEEPFAIPPDFLLTPIQKLVKRSKRK